MPILDWTRVDAGLFHAFHQQWIIAICNALNAGRLPADYFALPERNIFGPIPDMTLEPGKGANRGPRGDVAATPSRAGKRDSLGGRLHERGRPTALRRP